MAGITSAYVDILPTTGKIADESHALCGKPTTMSRRAAKRWSKEIESAMRGVDVEVDGDTKSAKKEIEKVEKGRYTAKVKVDVDLAKASRQKTGNIYLPGDTAVVATPSRMNGSAINKW